MSAIEVPQKFWGRGVVYERRADGDYDVLCGRCGGSGYIEAYGYIERGVCFKCNGHQGALSSISAAVAHRRYAAQVRAAEKKEAKRLAIVAERDARVARLAEAHPAVAEVLQQVYSDYQFEGRSNPFLSSLADQVHNADGRDLTDNQVAAVERLLAARAEKKANSVPVVEGRGEVSGEIVAIKRAYNDFGEVIKVTVQDERGFRVNGTLAKNLVKEFYDSWYARTVGTHDDGYGSRVGDYGPDHWFSEAKGAHIAFIATVVKSRDDESFGFFSRPTKGVRA